MSDQHDVAEVLPDQEIDHVGDMGFEFDVAAQKMGTFTDPRQGRREDIPPRRQQASHARPTPASVPCTVNQDEIGHCKNSIALSALRSRNRPSTFDALRRGAICSNGDGAPSLFFVLESPRAVAI